MCNISDEQSDYFIGHFIAWWYVDKPLIVLFFQFFYLHVFIRHMVFISDLVKELQDNKMYCYN